LLEIIKFIYKTYIILYTILYKNYNMIKAYTLFKNISLPYKKLVRLSKVQFATNPFNKPSDSKQSFMENAKN
jgi:hypothetical protein